DCKHYKRFRDMPGSLSVRRFDCLMPAPASRRGTQRAKRSLPRQLAVRRVCQSQADAAATVQRKEVCESTRLRYHGRCRCRATEETPKVGHDDCAAPGRSACSCFGTWFGAPLGGPFERL